MATRLYQEASPYFALRAQGRIVLDELPICDHVCDKVFVVDSRKRYLFFDLIGALLFIWVQRHKVFYRPRTFYEVGIAGFLHIITSA